MIGNIWDAVTLEGFWPNAFAYVGIAWCVTVALLRFAPTKCPDVKILEQTETYRGPATRELVQFTDNECISNLHFNHVILHHYAGLFGIFWAPILLITIPVAIIGIFISSILYAGNANVVVEKRQRELDIARLRAAGGKITLKEGSGA